MPHREKKDLEIGCKGGCVKNIERQHCAIEFHLQLEKPQQTPLPNVGKALFANVPKMRSIHGGFSY
jgi:hypothetical protein